MTDAASSSTPAEPGDKRSGKSALLAKFSDRISSDSIPSSSSSGERGAANSLLASASSAPEYSLDFSYTPVKNRHAIAAVSGGGSSGGDKEEVLARMNIWQLDEAQHCSLIPCFLQTGQHGAQQQQQAGANSLASPSSASAVAPASSSSSSSSAAVSPAQPLDFSTLDSAVFMLTFDLSEPWRALDTITTWLNAISKIILPALAALPEAQSKALKAKISKYTQSYYAPTADEAATDPLSPTSASSFDALSPSASSPSSNGAPPINPALPLHNLGVPIIIVGTKGDLFARHLGARSGGGGASGSGAVSGVDEKFDFLTRKLRKLCMEWGATLVYTSVAHHATGASRKEKDAGVNVEVLQHYILHRLYKFPLNPAAAAAADAAAAAAGVTDAKSPTAAAAASAAAAAAKFQPRVVGSAEDDFSIYIPAGYDSESLLDTTSKNAVSAAYNDATPVEEVLKNPQNARRKAGGAQQQQFDTVSAEDNAVFFKQLKHNLEQGGGGSALSLAAGLSSLGAPAHQRTATSVSAPKSSTPSHAHTASVSVVSPTSGLTAEQKAAAAAAGAPAKAGGAAPAAGAAAGPAAAGAAAGAGAGAAPVKGQIAVKQFFRSLLNNTSKPDANSKAAAQQKVVRANAEKELQRMTEGAPPQP